MKRLFAFAFIVSVIFSSCFEPAPNKQPTTSGASIYVEKIRGCDYVIWNGYRSGGMVHAGDCRNPIHGNAEEFSITSGSYAADTLIISHNNQ